MVNAWDPLSPLFGGGRSSLACGPGFSSGRFGASSTIFVSMSMVLGPLTPPRRCRLLKTIRKGGEIASDPLFGLSALSTTGAMVASETRPA